ncbi:hypothetical protein CEY00_Acc03555 [Actinidia chinensis var. chinensis]|uniref:Uncharacterized protein n=1 Tax=Actinidia chinensis var. chinensis TaxID=1590841 RepID=A0A2R6RT67_ACTCC|nr:hypothetical protein CEY00_Acc03555 [Actinidia chinensis var. chinensis]
MARKILLLPLILSLILYIAGPAESAVSTGFIRALCRATEYPVVCVQSVPAYARAIQKSPHQLAQSPNSLVCEPIPGPVHEGICEKANQVQGTKC